MAGSIDIVDYEPSPVLSSIELPDDGMRAELANADILMMEPQKTSMDPEICRPVIPHPIGIDRNIKEILNRLLTIEARICRK